MRRILMVAVAVAAGGLLVSGQFGTCRAAQARGFNHTTVLAYDTDQYTRFFHAGDWVTFAVSGDGDTDLDLFVYAPSGHLVAQDDDYGDDCLVRFVAPQSGRYTIRVKNLGGLSNVYAIGVN